MPRLWAGLATLAFLAAAAFAGTWFYSSQKQMFRNRAVENLEAIAELKSHEIAKWRAERMAHGAVLSEDQLISASVASFMSGPSGSTAEPLLQRMRGLQRHYGYKDILLVDSEGSELLSLQEEKGRHAVYKDMLREAFLSRKAVLGDLHLEDQYTNAHISVVAPVFAGVEPDAAPLGAFVLVCDAESFLYPLLKRWPIPSETAETTLSRREDGHVVFLNDVRHYPGAAFDLKIPLDCTEVPAVMGALGYQGICEGPDYRGVPVVSYVLPIPGSAWCMVSKQDAEEVYSAWRYRGRLILSAVILAMLLVAGAGEFAWQCNQKRHYREMYASEARLNASEERSRITLNAIGDAVVVADVQGRVQMLNPVAEGLTGWSDAEACGKPLSEVFRIVNEMTRETVESPVDKVLREGVIVGLANHTVLIAKDGSEKPIADSAAPIRDKTGAIIGVVLVFRDQTLEHNYRILFKEMLDGFAVHEIICDAGGKPVDYRFLNVNPAFERMTGLSSEEIVGKTVQEVLPQTERCWIERFGNVALTGEPTRFEEYSGELCRHFYVSAFRVAPGRFATVVQDVTERKKAEAEQARLAAAIEQSSESVVVTDTNGKITYVNRAFETVTGYRRDETIGQSPRILKSGKQDAAYYGRMWSTILNGEVFRDRIVNKRKDGTLFTEAIAVAPVFGNHGSIVSFVSVRRDITEHLRMEAELRHAQKMESVGRLAGGVAHDFNNTLGAILGNAELAIESLDPADPLRVELQEIINVAMHSSGITKQLLAFARKQVIVPKNLDMNETVGSMIGMLRRLVGENIKLDWVPAPGAMTVKADPAQLSQILTNLCVNARDAIGDVGAIVIKTARTVLKGTEFVGALAGEFVMLLVSDNGSGIDEETKAHLFEPFYTTKAVGKGTGLGLATVDGVVSQNNGCINVESTLGRGTSFSIYLPLAEGKVLADKAESAASVSAGRGEKVLVVEDDAALLRLTRAMLERMGYKVV
ncbi:MAG: PAS domain S-box protein, partial [Kiritimatiellae bacterium]|nr:PAS domain S-box protein [Kiritimatiellia bacterium]